MNESLMMNNQVVLEELAHAGESSPISPELIQLDGCRIMSDTEVPQEEFLLRMFGKPCFPRGDLSTITGLEKCGKTIFASMTMACGAEAHVLELERISETPLKVMWYDTEQSLSSTKGIYTDRILSMVKAPNPDAYFYIFNVRSKSYQERLDYLTEGIRTYKPDIVMIDNVSDLLSNINDAEQSIMLIDRLMQLAAEYNCNITVVIHLNRSGEKRNLRGWLGTEILHKAYEVYYCEQIENTDVFSVEQALSRKYHISEKLYYRMTDDGLPEVTVRPVYQPRDKEGRFLSNKPEAYQVNANVVDRFNQKYIIRQPDNQRSPWSWNLRLLFSDAMSSAAETGQELLKQRVMELSGIKQPRYYEKVFKLAQDQRIVKTTMDRNGRIVVILIPAA